MTSLSLLLWIVLGIVLQLAVYLGIGFWRHWQDYRALRRRATEFNLPIRAAPAVPEDQPAKAAWAGWRSFRVERKVVEDVARSVSSFYLAPEDGQALPPYLPGQFLTFRLDLPATGGGSEQIVRCYSLSDAPRADYYRISVKKVLPAGRGSGFFHDQVVVGSRVQVRAPSGQFHIDRSDAPLVLIAGGIGITPMLSIVNACLAAPSEREIWLFYGLRDDSELVMAPHLEALAAAQANFHLRFCFSRSTATAAVRPEHQRLGRIDIRLLRLELALKPYHFFLCGPAPMLENLVPALAEWGVPEGRIHYEAFGPASFSRVPAAGSKASQAYKEAEDDRIVVTFAKSKQQFPWSPTAASLLEFAEAKGIAVESGCRAGGCGTCQTTIRHGAVAYRQTPDYDPDPGTCLLCVCRPKTSVTLEV